MTEPAHVVRTQHFDTGAVEMMCGERREKWEDPERGSALCGGCAVELVNLLKHRITDTEELTTRSRRIVMREMIAQESTIEELTGRLRKVEKRLKKADKGEG